VGETRLDAQLLGRMRVTVGGHAITAWPRPSARRLLALLLLAPGHVLARDVIAERLFPHLDPAKAGRAISKSLSMARAALSEDPSGSGILRADQTSVWIAEHVAVEVDLFDHLARLEAALAAPDSGTPLDHEFRSLTADVRSVLPDDAYEDWAVETIDRVERLRREVALRLARSTGTTEDWQAVAAADPASEEACAALVDLHLGAGRRTEAVRVIAVCQAAMLALGQAPDPRLRRLITAAPEPAPGSRAPTEARWPLIGRDRELAALLAALRPAVDRRGGAVLIAAPAGTGKTHLLRHALDHLAADGWRIAAGTALPDDRLAPFAALRSALAPHLIEPPGPMVAPILLPAAGLSGERPAPPTELAALADALCDHLDRLAAAGPLVLCLDDIHWADRSLKAVITRLAAGIDRRAWSLLLAARTDEPDAPIPDLPTSATGLSLRPLDRTASLELAVHASRALGAHPDLAGQLAERGQGNPFFTVELVRSAALERDAARAVPERIVELLRHRLARCSPAARRLTALAAVAGDDATLRAVAQLAGELLGDGVDLARVVDELEQAALVRVSDGRLRLDHPLLRDAAIATINPLRRAELHHLTADAIERSGGRGSASADLAVGRHRLAAFGLTRSGRDADSALPIAFEAAAVARRLSAPDSAAELYRLSLDAFAELDVTRRAALRDLGYEAWLALGQIRLDALEYAGATAAFERAEDLAATVDERALAVRWRSNVAYRQGDLLGTIERIERHLATVPADEGLARARLLMEIGWCRCRRGELDLAVPVLEEAVELAEVSGDWLVLGATLDRLAFALATPGRAERSLPLYERSLVATARGGDLHELAITRLHFGVALLGCDRLDEARDQLEQATTLCDRHGFLYTRSLLHWASASVHVALGEPDQALASRDAELALLETVHNDWNLAGCQANRATLLRTLGRHADAGEAEQAARAAADRVGDLTLTEQIERTLAGQ
jgi:DNA-binding SARP family transcriptional activator/tetratricopeptide (TPR) repeat protein